MLITWDELAIWTFCATPVPSPLTSNGIVSSLAAVVANVLRAANVGARCAFRTTLRIDLLIAVISIVLRGP